MKVSSLAAKMRAEGTDVIITWNPFAHDPDADPTEVVEKVVRALGGEVTSASKTKGQSKAFFPPNKPVDERTLLIMLSKQAIKAKVEAV